MKEVIVVLFDDKVVINGSKEIMFNGGLKNELKESRWRYEPSLFSWWTDSSDKMKSILAKGILPQYASKILQDLTPSFEHKKKTIILKVFGSWVNTYNLDRIQINQISDLMLYEMKGHEYADSYKEGRWDGNIRLFDFKFKRFPIGFLNQVIDHFKYSKIEYRIEDFREVKTKLNLKWNGYDLRDYQLEAVKKAKDIGMGFLVLPTGSGKTEIGMKLIQELNVSSLILVHRSELLYQWKDRLEKSLNVEIGIMGDGKYDEKSITVAMVQTAYQKPPMKHYDCLIVDEAHHTPADTYYNLAGRINAMYRFGLSATPYREDGDETKIIAMTGAVNKLISVRDLIKRGYLADPIFETIPGYCDDGERRTWQEELDEACNDETTNMSIIMKAIDLTNKGYKVYIDVRRIDHGKTLANMLKETTAIKVEFIYGRHSSKTRQRVLGEFKNETMILISTLIKEGVDLPEMSAIILAGPAKSSTENIQKVGRTLRPKPGNNHAIIVDREDEGNHLKNWYIARRRTFHSYYEL